MMAYALLFTFTASAQDNGSPPWQPTPNMVPGGSGPILKYAADVGLTEDGTGMAIVSLGYPIVDEDEDAIYIDLSTQVVRLDIVSMADGETQTVDFVQEEVPYLEDVEGDTWQERRDNLYGDRPFWNPRKFPIDRWYWTGRPVTLTDHRDPCPIPVGGDGWTEACCACYEDHGRTSPCYLRCRFDHDRQVAICMRNVTIGLVGTCVATCIVSPPLCMGCIGLGVVTEVVSLVGCLVAAQFDYMTCVAPCRAALEGCLEREDCPPSDFFYEGPLRHWF